MPMHRERLRQVVLHVEAYAIAFGDLYGWPRYAAVEPPSIYDAAGNQFGADVLHSNVEHFDAVFQSPRHVGNVRTDHRNDPGAKLVRRDGSRGQPGAYRLLLRLGS